MSKTEMKVTNIFYLSDGRTIFVGKLDGHDELVQKSNWDILENGKYIETICVTSENFMNELYKRNMRALETFSFLNKQTLDVSNQKIYLVLSAADQIPSWE